MAKLLTFLEVNFVNDRNIFASVLVQEKKKKEDIMHENMDQFNEKKHVCISFG